MKIVILGTAGAVPSETAKLPAVMLLYEGRQVLFDCGEDVQGQFMRAKLRFNVPLVICISHMHGDHVIGLPGLLFNFHMGDRTAPLTIVGPPGLFSFLYHLHDDIGLKVDCPFEVREITPDFTSMRVFSDITDPDLSHEIPINQRIVFKTDTYSLLIAPVIHSITTFAYCFRERPIPGKFHPEVVTQWGIPEGPLWKKLQQGTPVDITGQYLDPIAEGIVDPPQTGRTVIYTGDTAPGPDYSLLCSAPDILIHESMYLNEHADLAAEKLHSTAADAARVAVRCQARYLMLTHRSSRYKDLLGFYAETEEIFPNVILVNELDTYELKKNHKLVKIQ